MAPVAGFDVPGTGTLPFVEMIDQFYEGAGKGILPKHIRWNNLGGPPGHFITA